MIQKLTQMVLLMLIFLISCNNRDDKPINISAKELIIEFASTDEFAAKKYAGKLLQIVGEIALKEFPKDTKPLRDASKIIFGEVNQRGSPYFSGNTIIICSFDEIVVHELNEGEIITIQCYFKNYGTFYGNVKTVNFNRGKIIKRNEDAAVTQHQ